MIDYASLMQGLRGPIQPVTLTPGFRAPQLPGPLGFAPRQQEQMGVPSIPGMGTKKPGMQPSTSGAVMGERENNGLADAVSAIQRLPQNAQGGYDQPPMPTDIGHGQGGEGDGSIWSQLVALFNSQNRSGANRGLIPPSGWAP